jgi:hypothetical protein
MMTALLDGTAAFEQYLAGGENSVFRSIKQRILDLDMG